MSDYERIGLLSRRSHSSKKVSFKPKHQQRETIVELYKADLRNENNKNTKNHFSETKKQVELVLLDARLRRERRLRDSATNGVILKLKSYRHKGNMNKTPCILF